MSHAGDGAGGSCASGRDGAGGGCDVVVHRAPLSRRPAGFGGATSVPGRPRSAQTTTAFNLLAEVRRAAPAPPSPLDQTLQSAASDLIGDTQLAVEAAAAELRRASRAGVGPARRPGSAPPASAAAGETSRSPVSPCEPHRSQLGDLSRNLFDDIMQCVGSDCNLSPGERSRLMGAVASSMGVIAEHLATQARGPLLEVVNQCVRRNSIRGRADAEIAEMTAHNFRSVRAPSFHSGAGCQHACRAIPFGCGPTLNRWHDRPPLQEHAHCGGRSL